MTIQHPLMNSFQNGQITPAFNANPPSPDLRDENIITATVRRPNPVFNDNVAVELLSNLSDALHASWNGWETACKYEDEDRQDYYMKVIRLCDDTMKKIKRF